MAEKVRADVSSYFTFSSGGDDVIVFPLRGHIVEIDYPESARDWVETDLDVLVDIEPVRQESPPALHDALRGLADSIDEVVLATDFDREGELIGVEALETLRHQHPELPARRARFSAMTTSEVRRAFENLVEPDWALAEAAAARQRIDLAWGAVLTRFLTVECGSDRQVLSAGRVQTPTLRLAADRERDREDFVPRPFWNVVLVAGEPAFEASAVGGPFWGEGRPRSLVALAGAPGPTPPRDHPPIHPTAAPAKRREGMRATVYDMIARRFLAPLSSPSLSTITEVHLRLGDTEFLAVGGVLVEPGWREILPDDRPMTELPALREGEELTVREVRVVEDRTTPPPLHTQGTLLLTMQRFALGTKSTRHEILDLLFRRQYISGRSIRTTAAGRALVDALTIYGPDVTDPEMTRHLEDRMTAIAEGRATLAEVVDESRRDLHEVLAELRAHQPSLVRWLRDATFLEKDYGPCDACPDGRMVRRRARNGWSFLGFSRFPACRRRLRLSAQGQRLPWTEPESLPETMRLPSPTPAA